MDLKSFNFDDFLTMCARHQTFEEYQQIIRDIDEVIQIEDQLLNDFKHFKDESKLFLNGNDTIDFRNFVLKSAEIVNLRYIYEEKCDSLAAKIATITKKANEKKNK